MLVWARGLAAAARGSSSPPIWTITLFQTWDSSVFKLPGQERSN